MLDITKYRTRGDALKAIPRHERSIKEPIKYFDLNSGRYYWGIGSKYNAFRQVEQDAKAEEEGSL